MTRSPTPETPPPAQAASSRSRTRSVLLNLLKFGSAVAILGVLLYLNWSELVEVALLPKDWKLFVLAFFLCAGAAVLTFVRWYLLVWAQELPFRLSAAIRLGFVGYVFNFVFPGLVGGDVVKAMFLAREQRRRTAAVATVVFDRLIGLLALFWVGAVASILLWQQVAARPELRQLAYTLWALSAGGFVGLGVLLTPAVYRWRWVQNTTKLPVVGRILGELYNAVGIYQAKLSVVLLAGLMSLGCHTGFILSFSLVSAGLGGNWHPSLGENFLTFPLAMFAGSVVPVPAGAGVTEGSFAGLYAMIRPMEVSVDEATARGVVTSLSYRVIMLAVAAIGGVIYLLKRREIQEVLHEADETGESVE